MYNSNNYGNPAIAYMYLRVYWSAVDPDPKWISIDFGGLYPDPDPGGKK